MSVPFGGEGFGGERCQHKAPARTGTMRASPARQHYGVVHGGYPNPLGLGTGQHRILEPFGTSATQGPQGVADSNLDTPPPPTPPPHTSFSKLRFLGKLVAPQAPKTFLQAHGMR